jgi:hypothetical protein
MVIDADLTLDYEVADLRDSNACIVDGVVHARFPPTVAGFPLGGELMTERARSRLPLVETAPGRYEIRGGTFGGSVRPGDLVGTLDPTILDFVMTRADLDPRVTETGTTVCESISYAFAVDMVPVTLGIRVD